MDDTILLAIAVLLFVLLLAFFGAGFWIGQRQGWRDITDRPCEATAPEVKAFDALGQYPALDDEDDDYLPF